jgi:hypothetical protein
VEEVGEGSATQVQGDQKLDAILLSVTASNVSSKNVYFLSNYWEKVGTRSSNANDNSWMREINQFQSVQNISGQLHYATSGKYYKLPPFERVAWGNLFPPSYFLYPKETVSTSVLFYVPQGTFDLVHVEIHIPTTEIPKMVDVLFVIDASKVTPKFFRIQPDGGRQEISEPSEISALPIQEAQSRRQLSLWRNDTRSELTGPGTPSSAPSALK